MDDRPKGRYFSVSSVWEFLECPQLYYHRRVARTKVEETQTPEHWRVGSAVHAALEAVFRAHAESGTKKPGSMSDYDDVARSALDKSWSELELSRQHGLFDRTLGDVQELLDRLEVPDRTDVVGVEQELLGRTPDGTIVIGYVDLLLRVDSRTAKIRDWKLGRRQPSANELVSDLQLNTYGWFVRQIYPWVERVVASNFPTSGREVSVELTDDGQLEAIASIEAVAEMVEESSAAGEWTPRPGERCGTCPFTAVCPAWNSAAEARDSIKGF